MWKISIEIHLCKDSRMWNTS